MKFVDFKIYTVATVLIDLLDQTEGNSAYKHKLKFHINKTIKEKVNYDEIISPSFISITLSAKFARSLL